MSAPKTTDDGTVAAPEDDPSDADVRGAQTRNLRIKSGQSIPGTMEVEISGTLDVDAAAPLPGPAPPPPPADAAPAIAEALGGRESRPWLRDLGQLAEGGMGRIHRVHDRRLRRTVAMKVLDTKSPRLADRVRFVEEAQITGQLDHPNIPPVHDVWLDASGELCFTMKLVHGETLTRLLLRRPLAERTDEDLERFLKLFSKVCDAVSFAHSRGVVHRDLKPDNIMVGTYGQVYVMDWGCALVLAAAREPDGEPVTVGRDPAKQSLEDTAMAIGTAAYMAPEQAFGQTSLIDERTDVYQLGSILYEILTGRAPHRAPDFVASLLHAQSGEVPDPQTLVAPVQLPEELCRIALRALARDREQRYASVTALKEDVELSLRNGWWFTTRTFPTGALVIREGDPADAAYIIAEGWCEAFRVEGGRRVVFRKMGPGEVFGETAMLTDRPRTASVEALEPMTVRVVTHDALLRALGSGGIWLRALVRALAERFRELDAQRTR